MKFCDERIQNHLLNGGTIRKIKSKAGWNYRPIKLDDEVLVFADNGDNYVITKDDLINDWEIVESLYDYDKIIKDKILCQFWNEIEFSDELCVGYLTRKTADGFYRNGWDCIWKHCKPFNPTEFNVVKDLKEYEKRKGEK